MRTPIPFPFVPIVQNELMEQAWYDFINDATKQRPLITPTFGATITIDATAGEGFVITASSTTTFTITAPTNPINGQVITLTVRNAAGAALGTLTWNSVFKMPAFTSPANGFSRSVTFHYNGTNWVQRYQSAADVPN